MSRIMIQIFDGFRLFLDGQEIPLSKDASEFMALITIAGGNKITAKIDWKIIKKNKGIKYNARIYTTHARELEEELNFFGIANIIHMGVSPVRFCRLDITKVDCDYYQMLNGQVPFGNVDEFLPEYTWAKNCYYTNWKDLRSAWK